jgi:hypothetical protein
MLRSCEIFSRGGNGMHSKLLSDTSALTLPVAEKILRPVVVYLFLVIGLESAGKRKIAQLSLRAAPPTT